MPSEILMYTSLIALGMLMFGSISLVMIGIEDRVQDDAIDQNLEIVTTKVAQSIENLVANGNRQIQDGASEVTISVSLEIPDRIQNQVYLIEVSTVQINGNTHYELVSNISTFPNNASAITTLVQSASFSLTGSIVSDGLQPTVTFNYDGTTTTVTLSY